MWMTSDNHEVRSLLLLTAVQLYCVFFFLPASRSCLHMIASQGETVQSMLENGCIAAPWQCTQR